MISFIGIGKPFVGLRVFVGIPFTPRASNEFSTYWYNLCCAINFISTFVSLHEKSASTNNI